MKVVAVLLMMSAGLSGAESKKGFWHRIRPVSQALLIVANSVDIASSFQFPEANPILRDPRTGQMLNRGVAIKAGVLAAVLVSQEWFWKDRRHDRRVVLTNLGMAALIGGVAARNFRMPREAFRRTEVKP